MATVGAVKFMMDHRTSFHIQLFREVFEYRTAGSIKKLWCCAGHLFVSTTGCKQLVTFDTKTLDDVQVNILG